MSPDCASIGSKYYGLRNGHSYDRVWARRDLVHVPVRNVLSLMEKDGKGDDE